MLRLEDIDAARCRPQFEAGIFEDLAWLGLSWEQPVMRQSARGEVYAAALERLRSAGLLYRDFRSRRQSLEAIASAPHGPTAPISPGAHPAEEEADLLARGLPFAWRLSVSAALASLEAAGVPLPLMFEEEGRGPGGEHGLIAARPQDAGDIVVARKDVGVSYHLAVVVDDAAQGVTHVIRGEDLFPAVPIQRLLQALLGLPTPHYRHHRLILRPDGKRFAKRDTAETLADLRARGVTPRELRRELGFG